MTTTKGNDGRAARRILIRRLAVVLGCFLSILFLLDLFGVGKNAQRRTRSKLQTLRRGIRSRVQGPKIIHVGPHDQEYLDRILSASVHLVSLEADSSQLQASTTSYSGVYGEFCELNFAIHKEDPSTVPMFRDIVSHSQDCTERRYRVDLAHVVKLCRQHDDSDNSSVKSLDIGGVAFHESRCGSTLVANSLMAMNPSEHRVYSESAPPIAALKGICGETFRICSLETSSLLLQDTLYLMGRSNDAREKRVFYKIQSVGTRNIQVFQHAFPNTPWMFLYRNPVEVMQSQLAMGPKMANCVRPRVAPPACVLSILQKSGYDVKDLTDEEYCAAHLASITESAVAALERAPELGVAVDYADLPDVLYEDILPNRWNIAVSPAEADKIVQVSQVYSKGRGARAGAEWHEDSERKEQEASAEIYKAAELFLQESYRLLKGETQHDDAL